MNVGNWLTIAGMGLVLFLSIWGFLYTTITRVHARIDKIEADNDTFWRILGPSLAGIIHSPTAHTRDTLVDKLFSGDITDADECRLLIGLLREAIASERWERDKKLAGVFALARACQVLSTLADDIEGCA